MRSDVTVAHGASLSGTSRCRYQWATVYSLLSLCLYSSYYYPSHLDTWPCSCGPGESAACCSRIPPVPDTGATGANETGGWTTTGRRGAAVDAARGNGDGGSADKAPTGSWGNGAGAAGAASDWSWSGSCDLEKMDIAAVAVGDSAISEVDVDSANVEDYSARVVRVGRMTSLCGKSSGMGKAAEVSANGIDVWTNVSLGRVKERAGDLESVNSGDVSSGDFCWI